ncbi:MAG: DUF3822 family protein, partial [Bacteroidetes bacterium]|nr:DUF3822 family protein [Bacteroidota bacterium]
MMVEKIIQINNNSKDLNNLNESHLSIQLSLDGFSFCIINKTLNEVTALYSYTFPNNSPTPEKHLENVVEVFKKEKLLNHRYHTVNITHVNELSTLVPKAFFVPEQIKSYIKYSSKVYKNDYIVHDPLVNHDMMNVYVPFVNINNFLLEKFGAFEYKHFSTVLVENLMNTYKFSERPHIFVHICDEHFEIVIIANSKLLLYNSFKYKTKEDFIYYVLFNAEQLKLDPEKFELIFSGDADKESELYKIAYTFIRNISLIEI